MDFHLVPQNIQKQFIYTLPPTHYTGMRHPSEYQFNSHEIPELFLGWAAP